MNMHKLHTNKSTTLRWMGVLLFGLELVFFTPLRAQSRISYNDRQLFLSGSNIAWVNFARDIGPDNTNFTAFHTMFDSVHANHGNAMRFWLHTNGQSSPAFDANGLVTGPGINTISDLKTILDLAWERKVGLILCLWSFDMLQNNNSETVNSRNRLMLNDTINLKAYIDNALIPMVSALKNHPAIIAWEIFNEAEGMSIEYGWPDLTSADIPMANIQRFVNKVTGAIHRTDSTAKVTTGAWAFKVLTDVTPLAKRASIQSILQSMTAEEKARIENEFALRYNAKVSAEEIITRFNAAAQDQNYYRDDRLIAYGGDSLGTLDFYTVHYYSWAGTALSPFHHPASYWQLDKPVVLAEFYIENTFGISYRNLYRNLYSNGYAGALTWQWYPNDAQQSLTRNAMNDLFNLYPDDLDVTQASGKVYAFSASTPTIDAGDTTVLSWTTSAGSVAFLNGTLVPMKGILAIAPNVTTEYVLTSSGDVTDASRLTIRIYPSGTIIFFKGVPVAIGAGDPAKLIWRTAKGSQATLNNTPVSIYDSLDVHIQSTTFYTLRTSGEESHSSQVVLNVIPGESLNRALQKPITVTPDDSMSSPLAIVDGIFDTQWASASVSSIKILIDLQQVFRIKKIFLSWGTNYAMQYRIVISTDNSSWTLAKQVLDGTGNQYTHDSLDLECRYFWLQLDKRASTASGYNLKELQMFGVVSPTGIIGSTRGDVPRTFSLFDNYPNPFNPSTTIPFSVPDDGEATLKIYNLLGDEITTLFHGIAKARTLHQNTFNGDGLSSGVYFARLTWKGQLLVKKLLLLR